MKNKKTVVGRKPTDTCRFYILYQPVVDKITKKRKNMWKNIGELYRRQYLKILKEDRFLSLILKKVEKLQGKIQQIADFLFLCKLFSRKST